jgi:hypothetical protein
MTPHDFRRPPATCAAARRVGATGGRLPWICSVCVPPLLEPHEVEWREAVRRS